MLLNLRRAVTFAVLAVGLVFAHAYLGTGISQLAFKSKADGSITPTGSTLIGQNWASPGRWFHGRPDDTGPYAADQEDIAGGDNPLGGQRRRRGVWRHQPRAPFERATRHYTRELVVYWHRLGVDPPRTW